MATTPDYEQPPIDEADLFYEWWDSQVAAGHAVAFGPGPGGRPSGYRESSPGRWSREGIEKDLTIVAATQVLFVREMLGRWTYDRFRSAWDAGGGWLYAWREEALRDPDVKGPLAETAGVPDTWGPQELAAQTIEAAGAWRWLVGQELPVGAAEAPPVIRVDSDVDPLRMAYGMDAPRAVTIAPFKSNTQRVILERGPDGRFTGRKEVRLVPILVFPHDSPLGKSVRIIDADRGGRPPRGALARIRTSGPDADHPKRRSRWSYVVPVDAAGKFPGSRLEDPRHQRRREVANAESVQLRDHRTNQDRKVEILVTPKSRNFDLARQFSAAFDGAREAAASEPRP